MLKTGLYKRIAILPGGTDMTPTVKRGGLDVFYREAGKPGAPQVVLVTKDSAIKRPVQSPTAC